MYPGLVPDALRTALRQGIVALAVVGPGFEGFNICSGPPLVSAGELRRPRACKPHVILMSWVWGLELHIIMYVVIIIMYLVLFSVYEKLLNKTDYKVNMKFFFSLRNPVLASNL